MSTLSSAAIAAVAEPDLRVRRLDWRFLVPTPASGSFERLIMLGASLDLCQLAETLGVATRVERDLSAHRADAVVVMRGVSADPRKLAAAVAPGGIVYMEIDRRQPGALGRTPRHVAAQLARAGLVPAAAWWTVPDFDDARRFIPLDDPATLDWYFASLFRQHTPARALAAAAARALIPAGTGLFAVMAPCFSVLAVAPPLTSTVPAVLRRTCADGRPLTDSARVALITSGQDDGSRVVLVPFDRTGTPLAVTKIARLARFNNHTQQEHAALAALRTRLAPPERDAIPTPLSAGHWHGLAVTSESYAPGSPIVRSSGAWFAPRRTRLDDLGRALRWLAEFQRAWTFSRAPLSSGDEARWIEAPLRTYARVCAATADERRLFDRVRESVSRLHATPMALVLGHNDFGPWNVHRDGDRLTVLDWEFAGTDVRERTALAGLDAIYFATHWLEVAGRWRTRRSLERACADLYLAGRPGRDAREARRAIVTYADRLQIDRRVLPALVVLTWVMQAIGRIARGTDPTPRNQYASIVSLLASHPDALFAISRWRS